MWFWYALASAIISAISVIVNKRVLHKVHALLLSWSLFAFPIPFLTILLLKDGLPIVNRSFFTAIVAASLCFAVAKTLALSSMKNSLLSKIYPLQSVGLLFVYLLGIIFLSEVIKIINLIGLFLIIIGVYIFNIEKAKENFLEPFKLLFTNRIFLVFLVSIILSNITAIFEKTALINSNPRSPIFVLLIENMLMSVLLSGYLTHKDRFWLREIKNHFWLLMLSSLIYTSLALFVFMGFSSGPVVLVIGIKKLEVLFVLLFSWVFFHDKLTRHTWIASLIMLAGVVLIKI